MYKKKWNAKKAKLETNPADRATCGEEKSVAPRLRTVRALEDARAVVVHY